MAEEILVLMADLDDESQKTLGGWYEKLKEAGFNGVQTPDLPFHVSLATFSPDKEAEVIEEMKKLAEQFSEVPVHISHIGLFAGGKVLYAAPDMNPAGLLDLRNAVKTETKEQFPWTPHVSILIDEKETIHQRSGTTGILNHGFFVTIDEDLIRSEGANGDDAETIGIVRIVLQVERIVDFRTFGRQQLGYAAHTFRIEHVLM